MRRIPVVAILALVATVGAGTAQTSAATFGAEFFGAFNTHSMEAVNNDIDALNGLGADMNNVSNGFTGGLNLRAWASPSWLLSAGWEPFFLSTKDKSGSNLEENFKTNVFNATAAYFFQTPGTAKYGVGTGLGYYRLGGELKDPSGVFSGGVPANTDVTGSTLGFHVMGMAEWAVSPGFAITGGAGYRNAKITKIEFGGQEQTAVIDYSGFIGRLGVAVSLPSAH